MNSTFELMSELHPGLSRNYDTGSHADCLSVAIWIATRLVIEEKNPYVMKVQGRLIDGKQRTRILPKLSDLEVSWAVHYVCCEGNKAYDPIVSPNPTDMGDYCLSAFKNQGLEMGIAIPPEKVRAICKKELRGH